MNSRQVANGLKERAQKLRSERHAAAIQKHQEKTRESVQRGVEQAEAGKLTSIDLECHHEDKSHDICGQVINVS
jgi:hypothetical protein